MSALLFENSNKYLEPFWYQFLSMAADAPQRPIPHHEHPLTKAAYGPKAAPDGENEEPSEEQQSYSARTHGPGFTVLAGYWTKVNTALLDHHPQEMLAFIKTMPSVVEGFAAHFETPAVVDLLFRLIQCEDSVPDSNIVSWLSERDLVSHVVSLLSPHASTDMHKAASEFLKTIISLSAPSPSSLNQVPVHDTFGGPGEMLLGAGGVNNILVRELASEENVNKMVSFMLDYEPWKRRQSVVRDEAKKPFSGILDASLQTLPEDSAVEEEEEEEDVSIIHQTMKDRQNRHLSMSRRLSAAGTSVRDSTATVRPSMVRRQSSTQRGLSQESITSSFVNCAGVFIELIRKNNSDYFEQHLFHTIRNYLVFRQQEIANQHQQEKASQKQSEPAAADKPELSLDDLPIDGDADAEGLEEAMKEVSEKMGIVHLGPLLQILAEKIPDLQEKMRRPPQDTSMVETTLGKIEPLTQTRYCIAELYAELLHCSNMALLNRAKNVGPRYSPSGSLMGGLVGLQALSSTLQGEDAIMPPDNEAMASEEWSPDKDEHEDNVEPPSGAPSGEPNAAAALPAKESEADLSESSESEQDDAASIASVLSSMSLADLTSQLSHRSSVAEESDYRIRGNYLKKQFLTYEVIPTLVELFLEFPWNNFLHNVVYDIIQQLFNGDVDSPINRKLIISTFNDACLVEAILEGVRRNRQSTSQLRHIRLGYMGHLNLIAEEIIKLLERYPMEVGSAVNEHFSPDWERFLNEELSESRAKESMPLAGGRPSGNGLGMQNWSNLESDEWYSENDSNHTFAQYLSAQMRTDGGDDESSTNVLAYMNDADPLLGRGGSGDDEWGPFADSSQSAFEFTSTASVTTNTKTYQENLTPADWAAEFRRGGATTLSDMPDDSNVDNDSDSDEANSVQGRDDYSASSTDSEDNYGDDSPYVDLHKPASLRQRTQNIERMQPDRLPEPNEQSTEDWPAAHAARHVRTLSSGGEDRAATLAAAQLPEDVEPTAEGLLRRTLADGTTVTVPLDDAELSQTQSAIVDDS